MAAFGKKITLFLVEGRPDGPISCELSNWTGKAYRIPRSHIRQYGEKNGLDKAGVYILFGKSDDPAKEGRAYIGEADGVRQRLEQHLAQKDFWNDAIVFISKDNNLNKAHIKYLESRLYEMAVETGRYKLENSNKPTRSTISEPDVAEMEEFIANIRTARFAKQPVTARDAIHSQLPECRCTRNQHTGRVRCSERLPDRSRDNPVAHRKLHTHTRGDALERHAC